MTTLSFIGLSLTQARLLLTTRLQDAVCEPAAESARWLLQVATGLDHAALIRDPDAVLAPNAADVLAAFAERRLSGEPLSRILGQRTFCGLPIAVRPGVLDPREDTETLVQLAADLCLPNGVMRILDLGTGSGALLCALLQLYPEARGFGVDRSAEACAAARENASLAGVNGRAMIVQGEWCEALRGPFDLIVSNPPYVATEDLAALPPEVRHHDPRLALDGGPDGLDPYRAILSDLGRIARPGATLIVEIGACARSAVEAILEGACLSLVGARADSGGHIRALAARFA